MLFFINETKNLLKIKTVFPCFCVRWRCRVAVILYTHKLTG